MNNKKRINSIEKRLENALSTLADSEGYAEINLLSLYNDVIWLIEQARKADLSQKPVGSLDEIREVIADTQNELKRLSRQLQEVNEKIETLEK